MNRSARLPVLRLVVASTATLVAWTAFAQTPPSPAPAAAATVVPPMDCQSPGDYPKEAKAGMNTMDRFQKKFDDYKTCVFKYADQMKAKALESATAAKAYQDAYNGAVTSYNDTATKLNEQSGAGK